MLSWVFSHEFFSSFLPWVITWDIPNECFYSYMFMLFPALPLFSGLKLQPAFHFSLCDHLSLSDNSNEHFLLQLFLFRRFQSNKSFSFRKPTATIWNPTYIYRASLTPKPEIGQNWNVLVLAWSIWFVEWRNSYKPLFGSPDSFNSSLQGPHYF